ncbi:MAG: DHH family phosphoesterase, partial [Clostridia bacterium]|nr:DHH family phosphoesterase [Clostridia bacterium]
MNKQIDSILSNSKTVAIIGHSNPDGDCFGSISAVYDYILDKFNCTVHCFSESTKLAEEFEVFVQDLNFNPVPLSKYDTCICVDCADIGRLGKYSNIFHNSSNTVCIDHHATNTGYADINIITNASSNCENIYYMFKENNYKANKSTLGKLCAGMITDTNNLTTDMVAPQTYTAFSEIQEAGVDIFKIRNYFFGGNTMVQFKLLALALNSAKFYNNNTILVMNVTTEQMENAGATHEDFSPIINQAFKSKDALCAILISPRDEQIHVSFRGKRGLDVSILAQHFGG